MKEDTKTGLSWAGLPVIGTVARLLCRELTLQNEYLQLENKILKSKITGRIRFTDDERWNLAKAAMAMGRELMHQIGSIVKPETMLAWQRCLERQRWEYSDRRRLGTRTTADARRYRGACLPHGA